MSETLSLKTLSNLFADVLANEDTLTVSCIVLEVHVSHLFLDHKGLELSVQSVSVIPVQAAATSPTSAHAHLISGSFLDSHAY